VLLRKEASCPLYGRYVLSLKDFYCQNEIIHISNGIIYIYHSLGPAGDLVIIFNIYIAEEK